MKRVKKKLMSRIMAVCLMLVMVLSTGMAVSAAQLTSESTASITISGIETDENDKGIGTLSVYRVISVNVNNNQPEAPVYTWDKAVAGWVNQNFNSYIDVDNSNAVTNTFLNLRDDSSELKAFVDQLANAIRKAAITLTPNTIPLSEKTPTVGDKGDKEITVELKLGAYLFLIEGGVRIYSPGFAAVYPDTDEYGKWVAEGDSIDVSMKSEEPGIDKTVSDYTYEIGQTVTYRLIVDVPDYPENAVDKKFIIADYLSEGLTLDEESIMIYNYSDTAEDNKGDDITDYFDDYEFGAQYPEKGANPSFAKSFTGDYDILASQVIVEYSATVNEKAVVMESTETGNGLDNKAYLIYNNNPYTDTGYREIPDEERVYTYGIEITKTGDGNTKLEGAKFTLNPVKGNLLEFVKDGGVYRPALSGEENATTTLVSDANGLITIKGLDLGTYILTETKAPEGYELPADPTTTIELIDEADPSTGKPDGILDNDVSKEYENTSNNDKDQVADGTIDKLVVNTKPGILPSTGGIGTAVFTVCAILLMAGAVLLMVVVSRRKNR